MANWSIDANNVIHGEDMERSIDCGLGELQTMILRMHDEKVIQVDAETGEVLTGRLLLNRAIKLAEWMKQNGVKPGDAVTINSENRIEYVIVPTAAFLIGAVFAPLSYEYRGELSHVLNLSKPKLAFCSNKTLKIMIEALNQHPFVQNLVLFGKKNPGDKRVTMYEDLVRGAENEPLNENYEAYPLDPDESIATVLCSSGTTGLPKGVMTTHANMTAFVDVARIRVAEMMDGDSIDGHGAMITLGLTPFFHSMGFMSMYMNMLGGNLVVVIKNFKMKLFLEAIQKYKITTLIVPPPIILLLIKHPLVKEYDLSSLREVRSGAAPMGLEMEKDVKNRYKLHHVSQGYGMTETTLGVLITPYNLTRIGSVGQIVPGMMAKVIGENGKTLGANQEGELCFKGPLIMKGYINDPVSTANTIDKEGWLHTGDVAYFDKDGFFFIVDRLKELIKYKAFQVAPAELEALLLTHPAVSDAAVIGLPDEEAGELPLAFAVKKAGASVTEKELQDFIAGKVARQKYLRGGVIFVQDIPKNPTGKILRRVLKERAKAMKSRSKL